MMITDFYLPYLGGVEQHVRSLSHALAAHGHRVVVVTLAADDLPARARDGAVEVRRLRSVTQRVPRLFSSSERPWAPPIADPAIIVQLIALLREERPDIVHGHDWLARSFLPLRRWSERRYGTRFVSSLHYYTLSCARKDLMQSSSATAGVAAERPCSGPSWQKCCACATRHYGVLGTPIVAANVVGATAERRAARPLIAVSEATARGNGIVGEAVDGHRRRPVRVIPNFLPPSNGTAKAGAGDGTADLLRRLPAGDFILFVGDLRPMKGLDVLLDAYAALDTAMPLVLIGKRWSDTPKSLPPGVVVHDRWPNAAVLEAWQRCAIAVVPSVWAEPFGIVVIEAMQGGAAVVASATGGIPEIIEDGVSGVLVRPGDRHALRRTLEELVADPERRAALGVAARRRAAAFSMEAVVPAIEATYRTALGSDRRWRSTSP